MAETTRTQTSPRRHIFIILGIAFILIVMEVWGNYPDTATSLERLELAAGDASLWIRGRTPPNEDIVIVAFDDKSLAEERERWPWPRSEFARIVNWLNEAGAKVIALDVLLFDESADPAEDQALAEASLEPQVFYMPKTVVETGMEAMKVALKEAPDLEAVVCVNDAVAVRSR